MFGDGNANIKTEDQEADDLPLDREEQKLLKEGLEAGSFIGHSQSFNFLTITLMRYSASVCKTIFLPCTLVK